MADFTAYAPNSPEAQRAEAAFRNQVDPAAPVASAPPTGLFTSPRGFYGPGVLANLESRLTGTTPEQAYSVRVPQLETASNVLGSLLAPGKTLATRMLGQAGVSGGLKALSGEGPVKALKAAAGGAGGQLVGEGIFKGLGRAVSGFALPKHAQQVEQAVTSRLQATVPAWARLPTLKDMFFTQKGWNQLHQTYDASLKEVIKRGESKVIQVSQEDAKALGVKDWIAPSDPAITTIGIKASNAAKAATGMWTKNPSLYVRVAGALDEAGVGDPAARKAYKTAMGLRAYFKQQGAIRPDGSLDLLKAQAGLVKGKSVDELLKRGLGEFTKLIAPGGKTIQKGSLAGPLGVIGGALGALGGHQFGLVPVGGLFGAYHGARLGSRIPTYANIPPGPVMNFLQRLGPLGPRLGAMTGSQLGPQVDL